MRKHLITFGYGLCDTPQAVRKTPYYSGKQRHHPKITPKCSFAVPEINGFGHIVSEKGIRPDISKVEATDYYSRWPETKILQSVTSKNILNWLLSVFASHGFPDEIKSDNASYFVSPEFKDTLASWGIQHKTVTEYWPFANEQGSRPKFLA